MPRRTGPYQPTPQTTSRADTFSTHQTTSTTAGRSHTKRGTQPNITLRLRHDPRWGHLSDSYPPLITWKKSREGGRRGLSNPNPAEIGPFSQDRATTEADDHQTPARPLLLAARSLLLDYYHIRPIRRTKTTRTKTKTKMKSMKTMTDKMNRRIIHTMRRIARIQGR